MNFLLAFPQTGFWMLLIKSNCREIRCTYTFLQLPLSIELNPKSFSTLPIPLMVSLRYWKTFTFVLFLNFIFLSVFLYPFPAYLSLLSVSVRLPSTRRSSKTTEHKFTTELLKLSTFKAWKVGELFG